MLTVPIGPVRALLLSTSHGTKGEKYSKCTNKIQYSKTSLIQNNWERTLVQMSESPNYRSATVNMLREVIKWTSRVFLCNTTLF
jgi:hypothetical protein